jgi:hypothetical protein
MAINLKKPLEELKIERLSYSIACGIILCIVIVLAVMYGRWLYNWYDSGIYAGSSGMIHFALWYLVVEFLANITAMVMGILGFKKKWTHWTKWE